MNYLTSVDFQYVISLNNFCPSGTISIEIVCNILTIPKSFQNSHRGTHMALGKLLVSLPELSDLHLYNWN